MHGPVLLLLIRNAGEGGESVATIEAMHTLRRRAGAAASTAARERTAVQLVLLGGERHGAGVLRGVGVDNLDASPDGVRVTMEPRESPMSRGSPRWIGPQSALAATSPRSILRGRAG
jgi:hypothetical protein